MQRLALTLPTPAENLALDEALLDWAEAENGEQELLRFWESPEPMVVVGRSSRVHHEVNAEWCGRHSVPILRRSSGGAAIVAGPGCLMYAVVLSAALRPEIKDIGRAHALVLNRLVAALQAALADMGTVACAGSSDLVFGDRASRHAHAAAPRDHATPLAGDRKFSGNSMRAKRTHVLYHGTLLYDFDLALIEDCLRLPPRQPTYRAGRPHREFIANLPISRSALVAAIDNAWPTTEDVRTWPRDIVANLVRERFSSDRWNLEFG